MHDQRYVDEIDTRIGEDLEADPRPPDLILNFAIGWLEIVNRAIEAKAEAQYDEDLHDHAEDLDELRAERDVAERRVRLARQRCAQTPSANPRPETARSDRRHLAASRRRGRAPRRVRTPERAAVAAARPAPRRAAPVPATTALVNLLRPSG
ncbi:MAG: hypothetical protein M3P40_06850 [Actinomycetota bacterium]|nr:hypothetical protein [Actinomycetota bacterium]